ncbi:E3 ubiquitin-protein ligase UBR1 [Thelohanellus kitauei]|uniref:E3 ubiquitin-protein ligase n=1 Tax=Thelohanellus kitauei TaxID=669202 RepID=A0A0C2JSQ2_THEKT|nr:E3 ubiquitin-protein ligase UBR1 [Thelohanellus kitauei]
MLNQVKSRLNYIIVNGLLLSVHDGDANSRNPFLESKLKKLVKDSIQDFLFSGFGEEVKNAFYSDSGIMARCTKVFSPGDTIYSCLDCRRDKTCVLCNDCFFRSDHVNHNYKSRESSINGGCCDCGDQDCWKKDNACTQHNVSGESVEDIPNEFMIKFGYILEHLFTSLEKSLSSDYNLLDSETEYLLDTFIDQNISGFGADQFENHPLTSKEIKTANQNSRKWCLIVVSDSFKEIDCPALLETLSISREDAKELAIEVNSKGYGCIKYSQYYNECVVLRGRWDNILKVWSKKPTNLQIIKVHNLYSLEVFSQLTGFINEFCSAKTQTYNLFVHFLTQETTLIHRYLFNEKSMCKSLRSKMINQVFMLLSFSDTGKIYLARIYLENLHQIYDSYLQGHNDLNCSFLILTIHFIKNPYVKEYFIQNGFLCKMTDCFIGNVKSISFGSGTYIMDNYNQGNALKMDRILTMPDILYEWLGVDLDIKPMSSQLRDDVNRTAKRLMEFCVEFDCVPIRFINQDIDKDNDYLIRLVLKLQDFTFRFIKLSITDRYLFSEKMGEFFGMLKRYVKQKKIMVENLTYNYVNQLDFIITISCKLFIHLLIHGIVNDYLPCEAYKEVLGDENMLVYIVHPFVQTLDYRFIFWDKKWHNKQSSDRLLDFYTCSNNIPFLNVQLLFSLQMIVSTMNPFKSLRHIFYCVFSNLWEKSEIKPILTSFHDVWISHSTNFHYFLILIFNVLYERHYIGRLSNWKKSLFERRVIHFLAIRDRTREEILDDALDRFKCFKIEEEWLDTALEKVSIITRSQNSEPIFSLKPKLYNIINPYHFMYNLSESGEVLNRLKKLYEQNQCKFELMEIPDLKEEFIGMNKFIFSKELHSVLRGFKQRLSCQFTQKEQRNENINILLMYFAVISKLAQNHHFKRLYEDEITYIFGNYTQWQNKSVFDILLQFTSKTSDPMRKSIIEYIFEVNGRPMLLKSLESRAEDNSSQSSSTSHLEEHDNNRIDVSKCVSKLEPQIDQRVNEFNTKESDCFCEICLNMESVKHVNLSTFHYPTSHLCFAFVKWSRTISKCQPACVSFVENVTSNPNILFEAIEKFDASRNFRPEISISGCSHLCHLNCATFYGEIMNRTTDHLGSNSVYNCCLCKAKNNFVIPMNFTIEKNIKNVESYAILYDFINMLISINTSNSSSQGHEVVLEASNTKSSIDERLLSYLNSPTDSHNFYLKNCSVFYDMECSTGYNNARHYFDLIISRSTSSLIANIGRIELDYRHTSPSFPSNDFQNIKINKQFALYCFYTCGLAPALKACNFSNEEISGYLTPIYIQKLKKLKVLAGIFDPSQQMSDTYNFQINSDRFEEFVSSFMAISAIMNLNPRCREQLDENFEYPLVRLFHWLVIFDVFAEFYKNGPCNESIDSDVYISDVESEYNYMGFDINKNDEDIDFIHRLYCETTSSHILTPREQLLLFTSCVYNALLYLRKVWIFFYEIYDIQSPLVNLSTLVKTDDSDPIIRFRNLMNHFSVSLDKSLSQPQYQINIKNWFKKLLPGQSQAPDLLTRMR